MITAAADSGTRVYRRTEATVVLATPSASPGRVEAAENGPNARVEAFGRRRLARDIRALKPRGEGRDAARE